ARIVMPVRVSGVFAAQKAYRFVQHPLYRDR
ncbi:MAG: hypothetical protein ACI8PT_004519, partial [Gammaproteobacteria bacterium]